MLYRLKADCLSMYTGGLSDVQTEFRLKIYDQNVFHFALYWHGWFSGTGSNL